MIGATLRLFGQSTQNFLGDLGAIWRLATTAASQFGQSAVNWKRIRVRAGVEQVVRAGYSSTPLVTLICFLLGMILALQAAYQLRLLGALDLVPNLVAVSVSRELGPLLAAIVVAGRFGSAMAAELGTMKVSQEIDALTVMGIDPVHFLVLPRLIGLIVALPCLTVLADVVGILGGLVVSVGPLDMGAGRYVASTFDSLVLQDVYAGLVKSVAFAVIIGLVSCHQGLQTEGGAEEVGRSTTASVVRSIAAIIAADLFVTALFHVRG